MRAGELIEGRRDAWRAATEHPFLAGLREGTLDPARFARLARAGLPVRRCAAVVSGPAAGPRLAYRAADPGAWRGGAGRRAGLVRGRGWAAGSVLGGGARCEHPGLLDTTPTPVALVALWALERVYRDAWQSAAPGAEPYREIVAHWTEPGFADYVAALEHLADTALTDFPSPEQQTVFDQVLRLEIAFWDAGTAIG